MPLTWGQALRFQAEAVGLGKAKDLAAAAGISASSVSDYFNADEAPNLQPGTREALRVALQLEDQRDLDRLPDLVLAPNPSVKLVDLLRVATGWEVTRALMALHVDGELAVQVGEQLSLHQRGPRQTRSTPSTRPASAALPIRKSDT